MFRSIRAVPLKHWLLAARPKTLPAAVSSIVLGNALAIHDGYFSWWIFLLCLLCAMLLQVGVNLANDYFDFRHGHDTAERLGPLRVSQQGLISEKTLLQALKIVMALAAASGLVLVVVGGWPIFWLGVLSLLGVLAYSGGPRPLASHALGDIAVFIFFGLVAVGASYFLQTGHVTGQALVLGSAMGVLNIAILVINNLRDRVSDAKTGKRTLAVKLGRSGTLLQYQLMLFLAFALPFALWTQSMLPSLALCLVLLCVPDAIRLIKRVKQLDGVVLNHYLGQTAQFTLWYSLLISFGLIITV